MELRHWVAYGLIAATAASGSIASVVAAKRRARRRLRLRGIKTGEYGARTTRSAPGSARPAHAERGRPVA